ncbi:hypothetical protein [Roseateles flavus]|uniref:Uncharacterized protein n=1 Tax=Roseateles flavus TaxID=3149041 RepID=A0ABV0GIX3_9BURK
MNFHIRTTTGGEVIFEGFATTPATVYYGGPPPETGRWRVDIPAFEAHCARHLAPVSFGASIDTFFFGLEIAELDGWGDTFTATRTYTSYRPKMRALVSVGQIEWAEVKHLPCAEQVAALWAALLSSIERVASMKRRPKDFDAEALASAVRLIMASSDASMFAITHAQ